MIINGRCKTQVVLPGPWPRIPLVLGMVGAVECFIHKVTQICKRAQGSSSTPKGESRSMHKFNGALAIGRMHNKVLVKDCISSCQSRLQTKTPPALQ